MSQKGDFELEYRVVDGGSNDGTVKILERYGNRFAWTSERDKGQIDAINKGLRGGHRGDRRLGQQRRYRCCPAHSIAVARAFRENPKLEWLHGRCEIIDPQDRPVREWVSLYKHFRASRHSFDNLLTENYVSQMTAFWRRSVHEEIGYINPSLNLAFDYDLWLRLAKRSDPLYIPERLACFRWYPSSKSGAGFHKQFQEDEAVAQSHAGNKRW